MATDPTKQELEDLLTEYRKAEKAAAGGKSYAVDGLSLTRHDLPFIRREIDNIRRQMIQIDQDAINDEAPLGQRTPVWN